MNRTTARLSAALLTVALVGIAGPAFAHVSVSSTDATQGGFGKAVFRVPTESETASTTKLVVTLPEDAPFAFVSAQSKPGWKVSVKEVKLDKPTKVGDFELTKAVRAITWTSTGGGIPPSEFDEFGISGGPFPDTDKIAFSAEQTYSDGKVVAWDQVQKGDTVLTQGGLRGKLVEVGDRFAKVEIAPGVKIEVLKGSLLGKDTVETASQIDKK